MKPAYLKLSESGELERRADAAFDLLEPCRLCPERCGAKRKSGEKGRCGASSQAIVADHAPHFGEEPPLSGTGGSGTVFFSGCNMHCIYCQNFEISQMTPGMPVTPEMLAFMFLMLQEQGCHNINLVTPSHVVPMILLGIARAADEGLHIPIVYNSGGYDSIEILQLLDGIVDIYLPDLKYMDEDTGLRLSGVKNYPQTAQNAIREMHRQTGPLQLDSRGIATRGVLVRHLVLPGGLAGTEEAVRFMASELGPGTWTNIMRQYRPCWKAVENPELNRNITDEEYRKALHLAAEAGLHLCC